MDSGGCIINYVDCCYITVMAISRQFTRGKRLPAGILINLRWREIHVMKLLHSDKSPVQVHIKHPLMTMYRASCITIIEKVAIYAQEQSTLHDGPLYSCKD